MLCLSRQKNESIRIGDDVIVMVLDIRGDKCRLGIDAPQNTPVHRSEVHEAIQRSKQDADEPTRSGANGRSQFTLEERIRNIITDIRRMKFRDQAQLTAALEGAIAASR